MNSKPCDSCTSESQKGLESCKTLMSDRDSCFPAFVHGSQLCVPINLYAKVRGNNGGAGLAAATICQRRLSGRKPSCSFLQRTSGGIQRIQLGYVLDISQCWSLESWTSRKVHDQIRSSPHATCSGQRRGNGAGGSSATAVCLPRRDSGAKPLHRCCSCRRLYPYDPALALSNS